MSPSSQKEDTCCGCVTTVGCTGVDDFRWLRSCSADMLKTDRVSSSGAIDVDVEGRRILEPENNRFLTGVEGPLALSRFASMVCEPSAFVNELAWRRGIGSGGMGIRG